MVEIVAEISGNHGGSLEKAKLLIMEAALAGCDYAKFQLYRPEDMPDCDEGENATYYEMCMVPEHWLPELFRVAKHNCIGLFASVFSVRAANELLKYDVPYIKIASPESTRLPMKAYEEIGRLVHQSMARLMVSTGFGDRPQMKGLSPHRLLYCPPGHPAVIGDEEKREYWSGGYHGFSDHTPGLATPLWFADQPGARMIEKHFKIDDDCVDAAFSADPQTMKLLSKLAKNV